MNNKLVGAAMALATVSACANSSNFAENLNLEGFEAEGIKHTRFSISAKLYMIVESEEYAFNNSAEDGVLCDSFLSSTKAGDRLFACGKPSDLNNDGEARFAVIVDKEKIDLIINEKASEAILLRMRCTNAELLTTLTVEEPLVGLSNCIMWDYEISKEPEDQHEDFCAY